MKSVIILLIFSISCCYCVPVLDNWTVTSDQLVINGYLEKALADITKREVDKDLMSRASDILCQTQMLNGQNIRLTFGFDEKRYRCTFFKSLIQTLELQLEKCSTIQPETTSTAISTAVSTSSIANMKELQERVEERNDAPDNFNQVPEEENPEEPIVDSMHDEDEANIKIDLIKSNVVLEQQKFYDNEVAA